MIREVRTQNVKWIMGIILFSFLSSCSGTKFLKDGDFLYTGSEIKIKSDSLGSSEKKELKSAIEGKVIPKPNSSFLGLRPRLYFYLSTKEPEKQKGFRYWLKYKVGEKPVLLKDVDREFNKEIIQNYAENKGYFNAKTKYDTISSGKKAKVIYELNPKSRYTISKVTFPTDSTILADEIRKTEKRTFLKVGEPFDLDVIKAERERIDTRLKQNGFYYFHPDNLLIQADSTVSTKQKVELLLKVKSSTPEMAINQFTIDKVVIFPDYNLQGSRTRRGVYQVPSNYDTIAAFQYKDMYIIDPKKKFKPKIFDRAMYFEKGDLYNRADHNLTLNRLISLGVFKFVKNDFIISDSLNHKFDVYYTLTPRELQSLRLEILGRTNSANYGGGEVNLNWTHRNFFRGAEQLKATAYGAMDVQMGGPKDANNIIRFGGNATLTIPRIVAPWNFKSSSAFVPRTTIALGYEFQNRTKLYSLHSFSGSFGYQWKENARKEHELKLLDVTLVKPQNITPEYDSIMNLPGNQYLKRVVERQLIFGPSYSYTYTTTMLPRTNTYYYKGSLDLAGTLTGLISGANVEKDREKTVFGIPFSQYVKTEHDVRFYHKFGEKTSFASRFIGGIAYPYGNSEFVPFSRQFFVGGSNSVRAFRARTLGPGSYDPRSQNARFFFDQAGDIKLELNAEYRANLYKFLNVAAFVDAGNIWLINDDPERPGGKFSKNWLSEIAVGAGAGVRLDFSILILRLDLAVPLRVPYYEKNDRWMFDKIKFGDAAWRKDNLIFNIAIGYPF